jgi:hypothetical protein
MKLEEKVLKAIEHVVGLPTVPRIRNQLQKKKVKITKEDLSVILEKLLENEEIRQVTKTIHGTLLTGYVIKKKKLNTKNNK